VNLRLDRFIYSHFSRCIFLPLSRTKDHSGSVIHSRVALNVENEVHFLISVQATLPHRIGRNAVPEMIGASGLTSL
jgi:hypothetical protein